jgi:hypothetical protein
LIFYPTAKQGASYTIPNSVDTIDRFAFDYCRAITFITIPSSVSVIREQAISDCYNLISINVASENSRYTSDSGVLFNKNKTILICYPAGKKDSSYVIPNSVSTISRRAFSSCYSLTSLTIPSSVVYMWDAFSDCRGLTEVVALNPNPVDIAFAFGSSSCVLKVLARSLSLYQAANVWKLFSNIIGFKNTDATLKSLTVSAGTLTPNFNADSTTYKVSVANSISSITLMATATDSIAFVSGAGTKTLGVGLNNFSIVVKAEDSIITKTYTLVVTRATATPPIDTTATAVAANALLPLKLYPNPVVNGELTINNEQWVTGEAVKVYSLSGVLVATYKTAGEHTTINLSQLPSGTYVVRVGNYVGKLVKQ